MTLMELKARGYDAIALIEQGKRILAEVNQQIANYREPAPAHPITNQNPE